MARIPAAKIWQIASFDKQIRSRVALELLCSWPAPNFRAGSLGCWFFYYASFGPPPAKEFKLYPPSWTVWILASNGSVRDLKRVQPRDVGLTVKEGEPFAAYSWPKSLTSEIADRKRGELFERYDSLLPVLEARRTKLSGSELRDVEDFRSIFLELTPQPLLPCYKILGADFFRLVKV